MTCQLRVNFAIQEEQKTQSNLKTNSLFTSVSNLVWYFDEWEGWEEAGPGEN